MKKLLLLSAMVLTVSLMPSCQKSEPVSAVTLPEGNAIITVGQVQKVTATLSPAKAKGSIVWESTDPSVLSVDSKGNVTGLKPGLATIYASCGLYAGKQDFIVLTDEGTVYRKGKTFAVADLATSKQAGDASVSAYQEFTYKFDKFTDPTVDISEEWLDMEINPKSMPSAKTKKETGFYFCFPDDKDVSTWYNYVAGSGWSYFQNEKETSLSTYSDVSGFIKVTSSSVQMVMTIQDMLVSINLKK